MGLWEQILGGGGGGLIPGFAALQRCSRKAGGPAADLSLVKAASEEFFLSALILKFALTETDNVPAAQKCQQAHLRGEGAWTPGFQ